MHYLHVDEAWRHISVKGEYCGGYRPIYQPLCRPNRWWSKTRWRQLDKAHDVSDDAGAVTCRSCIGRLVTMMEEHLHV